MRSYSGTARFDKETKSDLKRQTMFNAVEVLQQNHLIDYILCAIITVVSDLDLSFMEFTGLKN